MNREDLRAEAIAFGRYLIGAEPSPELVERYCRANEELLADATGDADVEFVRRHPWSVAMLDAAAGLRGDESLLRKKLLVMTAIVETTPELVDRVEPRTASVLRIAMRVGVAGARTVMSAAAGLALRAYVRRRA